MVHLAQESRVLASNGTPFMDGESISVVCPRFERGPGLTSLSRNLPGAGVLPLFWDARASIGVGCSRGYVLC